MVETFEEYAGLEMLQLLEYLKRERFPGLELENKKEELKEEIAKRLELEAKEVGWIVGAERKGKDRNREEDQEREDAFMKKNKKQWEKVTREVSSMAAQMRFLAKDIEGIRLTVKKIEKSYETFTAAMPALEPTKEE